MRASSPQADATAPLRASARTAWRSVGQGSKPRAAAATASGGHAPPAARARAATPRCRAGHGLQRPAPRPRPQHDPAPGRARAAPRRRARRRAASEAGSARPIARAQRAEHCTRAAPATPRTPEQGHAGHEPDRAGRVDPAPSPARPTSATPATTRGDARAGAQAAGQRTHRQRPAPRAARRAGRARRARRRRPGPATCPSARPRRGRRGPRPAPTRRPWSGVSHRAEGRARGAVEQRAEDARRDGDHVGGVQALAQRRARAAHAPPGADGGDLRVGRDDAHPVAHPLAAASAATSRVAAGVGDLALGEQHAAIGQALGEAELVGGEQDRAARRLALEQQLVQQRLRRRVEPDDGLVEEQQRGGADERARELGLLAHAARELGRAEVAAVREPEALEQRVDALGQLAAAEPVGHADELEVLAHGEVVVEQRVVGHERQPRAGVLGLGLAMRVEALDAHLARRGLEQAGQRAHRGRLAAAVGADERDALPGGDRQREVAQRLERAERAADAARLQGRRVVHQRSAAGQAIR